MSIHNLRLCGEIRNLICGDFSSLVLWIDLLIWSYNSGHVQIDQRNRSSVNTLRQFIAPDKASFLLVKKVLLPLVNGNRLLGNEMYFLDKWSVLFIKKYLR